MKIICSNDYIYGVCEEGIQNSYDFYLRFMLIDNDSEYPVTINSIQFNLYSDSLLISSLIYSNDDILSQRFKAAIEEWNYYRQPAYSRILGYTSILPLEKYSTSSTLNPNQQAIWHQEYFRMLSLSEINRIVIQLRYIENGTEYTSSKDVEIRYVEDNTNYIFPLKEKCFISDTYTSLDSHRWCYNSEFAFDVGMLHDDGTYLKNGEICLSDYAIYGKEIYAIADGIVKDIYTNYPEFEADYEISDEEKDNLYKTHGENASIDGNFVVIEHSNGDCSLYAHMIPHSSPLEKGQMVKQGDFIGKVGNSGNSTCPHLHFHVADSVNTGFGVGKPCSFTNIHDIFNGPIKEPIKENTIIITN